MGKAKKISLCAILIALALALSYMERFVPMQLIVPLPGFKLGLANIVTLVALAMLKPKYAFGILIARCVFGAAFGGGFMGLAFSMCGGALALCAMVLAPKSRVFSVYGISVLGAAVHNVGQVLVAMVLMHSVYVGAYLPYLLLLGVITGLLTGSICAGILRVLPKAGIPLGEM